MCVTLLFQRSWVQPGSSCTAVVSSAIEYLNLLNDVIEHFESKGSWLNSLQSHCGFRWWHQLRSCTSEVLGGRVCVQCGRLVSATCWRCCSAEGSTAPWGSSQWWGHPEHISWLFLEDEPATFCQPLWSQTGCPLCGCWLFPPTPATKQEKKQSYWLKVSFSALKLEWKTFNSKP